MKTITIDLDSKEEVTYQGSNDTLRAVDWNEVVGKLLDEKEPVEEIFPGTLEELNKI